MLKKLKEECGIFGGYSKDGNISSIVTKGLFYLQHRGQDSAGICCGSEKQVLLKNKGLVMEALPVAEVEKIAGEFGIGHVRYSTKGGCSYLNAQPFLINYFNEDVSIAHNGNIEKAMKIREKFERIGEVFLTSSDSEVVLKRIVFGLKKPPSEWGFEETARCLYDDFGSGAFSLVLYMPNRIFAFRDAKGYRPLLFCEAEEGFFVASEDVAFSFLNVKKIIEIGVGEGIEITKDGYRIKKFVSEENEKKCVFEQIYFANLSSNVFGRSVYQSRVELGKKLAEKDNIEADVVIPIPDSGMVAAIGYSQQSKIPMELGILKNHWVGRSFIEPTQKTREMKVKEKLSAIASVVKDKRIVVVDDSLVRAVTSKQAIDILKKAGAKEVHLRIASPMILNTCFWGVDIPTKEELVTSLEFEESKIADIIGATSLKYLDFEELVSVFGEKGWCYNCFGEKND